MKRGSIVLCGGKSTRMGSSKAWLPFGPETMLERVVRLLGEVVERIVVVAAAGQDLPPLPADVLVARDTQPQRGPLEGLAAGMKALDSRADALFLTGCDAPLLVPAFVERMFEVLGEHDAAVPRDGEFYHPLSAVYHTRVLPQVESLLSKDQLRAAMLLERVHTVEVPVDDLREADFELATLQNLNRPEDYQAALRRAGFA